MDKEQFEQLVALLKQHNEYMEAISSWLHGIDNNLDLITDELTKRGPRKKG